MIIFFASEQLYCWLYCLIFVLHQVIKTKILLKLQQIQCFISYKIFWCVVSLNICYKLCCILTSQQDEAKQKQVKITKLQLTKMSNKLSIIQLFFFSTKCFWSFLIRQKSKVDRVINRAQPTSQTGFILQHKKKTNYTISQDICTLFLHHLYSSLCSWIIKSHTKQ